MRTYGYRLSARSGCSPRTALKAQTSSQRRFRARSLGARPDFGGVESASPNLRTDRTEPAAHARFYPRRAGVFVIQSSAESPAAPARIRRALQIIHTAMS